MPGTADHIASIIALLADRPAPPDGPRVVSIDGPAGSGKTTLAGSLETALLAADRSAALLHLDDLYEGWAALEPDPAARLESRLVRQVFEPLSRGRASRWQRYDWEAGRLADWVPLGPADVLIVEGCGSGARAYSAYRSLLVWVEAPRRTRIARGVARDGEQVRERWLAWMASEAAHFSRDGTPGRADLTVVTR